MRTTVRLSHPKFMSPARWRVWARRVLLLAGLMLFFGEYGCEAEPALPPIQIESVDRPVLYQWKDTMGRIQTATVPHAVPEYYRAAVYVTDPNSRFILPIGWAMMADLSDPDNPSFKVTRTDARPAAGHAAMQGASPKTKAPVSQRVEAAPSMDQSPVLPSLSPEKIDEKIRGYGLRIILYTTEWCGNCKKAKRYFDSKKIRYSEKDVEKDSKARDEMMAKLRSIGRTTWAVPVIEVGNDTLVGFSPSEMQALLMRKVGLQG